jgi:LPXTG-motif cell wall-anchored protein
VDNVLIMKDSKVTAKGKKKPHRSTRTGDDANAALWAVLAAAAAAGAAGTVIARKRKKGNKG